MRKYLMAMLLVFGPLGTSAVATAQPSPEAVAQVQAILAQFPNGGPGLRAAIARAVVAEPSLAEAVVAAAAGANPAQQQSIGAGLADAATFFSRIGSAWAQAALQVIQSAMASAPPGVLAAFTFVANSTGGQGGGFSIPSGLTITASRCVSPSGPPGPPFNPPGPPFNPPGPPSNRPPFC